jgi:hypothetical protein
MTAGCSSVPKKAESPLHGISEGRVWSGPRRVVASLLVCWLRMPKGDLNVIPDLEDRNAK